MSAYAVIRGVNHSPRKVGEVAALVRGRSVADALVILEYTPRRAARYVREAIKSAAANAEHNHEYKPDSLKITEISVTPGPRFKRFRAAARGGVLPYQLKTSHIRVVVDGDKRVIKKTAAKPATASEKEAK